MENRHYYKLIESNSNLHLGLADKFMIKKFILDKSIFIDEMAFLKARFLHDFGYDKESEKLKEDLEENRKLEREFAYYMLKRKGRSKS